MTTETHPGSQAEGAQYVGAPASDRFTEPTLEMVEHAFRELEWAERFTGYKMSSSVGNTPTDLYSLKDAVVFLVGTRWDRIGPDTHKASLNWVDVAWLVAWLRDTVGDTELAEAVEAQALPLESFKAQSDVIADLLVARMDQYRSVLDAQSAAEEAPSTN